MLPTERRRGIRLPKRLKNRTTGKPAQVLQVAKTFCWRKEKIPPLSDIFCREGHLLASISTVIPAKRHPTSSSGDCRIWPEKASNNATALSSRIDRRNTTPSKKIFAAKRKIEAGIFSLLAANLPNRQAG